MAGLAQTAAPAAHGAAGYKTYWFAWLLLLILTVLMVRIHNKALLLTGIGIKSTIICLWFMHLKHESKLLVFSVALGFGFAVFLFFLIQFDVKALTGIA